MTVLSPDDRKAELRRLRKTGRAIARATGQSTGMVSHVLGGRRLNYEGADKIMAHVARLLQIPVDVCFPELNNRRGEPA